APLLLAVRDALVAEDWAVLRFNFRGIGASQGTSSTGRAEVADAAGVVHAAREHFQGFPVAIAGWSFGAAVAVRYTTHDRDLAACVAIAPAVRARPGVTDGLPDPNDVNIDAPLLVICGANDELVEPADCRGWAEIVSSASFIEMRGANHFFWGKYDELAATVSDFLDDVV
ncbi:MAG: alpha/beta hydrolase, partial [Actinomycetota bacterium]|nr:alpha/beta hydrolase [Actinomycetota bacterium]